MWYTRGTCSLGLILIKTIICEHKDIVFSSWLLTFFASFRLAGSVNIAAYVFICKATMVEWFCCRVNVVRSGRNCKNEVSVVRTFQFSEMLAQRVILPHIALRLMMLLPLILTGLNPAWSAYIIGTHCVDQCSVYMPDTGSTIKSNGQLQKVICAVHNTTVREQNLASHIHAAGLSPSPDFSQMALYAVLSSEFDALYRLLLTDKAIVRVAWWYNG